MKKSEKTQLIVDTYRVVNVLWDWTPSTDGRGGDGGYRGHCVYLEKGIRTSDGFKFKAMHRGRRVDVITQADDPAVARADAAKTGYAVEQAIDARP